MSADCRGGWSSRMLVMCMVKVVQRGLNLYKRLHRICVSGSSSGCSLTVSETQNEINGFETNFIDMLFMHV